MSGRFGPCDCPLGRSHAVTCPNFIDLDPCPCGGKFGRHYAGCVSQPTEQATPVVGTTEPKAKD